MVKGSLASYVDYAINRYICTMYEGHSLRMSSTRALVPLLAEEIAKLSPSARISLVNILRSRLSLGEPVHPRQAGLAQAVGGVAKGLGGGVLPNFLNAMRNVALTRKPADDSPVDKEP